MSKDLIFQTFEGINSILQLEEYFRPMSIPQIKEFLSDDMLYILPEHTDELLKDLSYQLATRFYIAATQPTTKYVLNNFTAEQIRNASQTLNVNGLKVELTPNKDQIKFPITKSEAHIFLRFLNEEYFKGMFTQQTYSTTDKTSEIV